MSRNLDLEDRVVLVTGGGRGLGRAICLACADAGAAVVLLAPGENGAATAAAITHRGGRALWVRGNVGDGGDVAHAVAEGVAAFGSLDGVVHNAVGHGAASAPEVDEVPEDGWRLDVAVSLRGAYNLAIAALPHLKPDRGRFLVMTSPAAMEGSVRMPAYAAVKGAMRGFAKSLAVEWGPLGIAVTVVSPLALSEGLSETFAKDPALKARFDTLVPLGRPGDPLTDVAPVIAFLMGDGARYVSGQTIIVDGGRFTTL